MNFLMKETAGLPNWAWGLVVAAGLGIGYFVMRSSGGGGSSASTTTGTTATPTTPTPIDANAMTASGVGNGQPQIVVLPLASPVASSVGGTGGTDSGGSGNTSTSTDSNSGTGTVSTAPAGTPRGRNVSSTVLTIRNKGGSSIKSVQDYDNTNPPGVPVRAVPGGVQVRFQAYGSQVAATGAEVSGPNNTKEGTGSDSWWPVQSGYISAFDVSGISQQNVSVVRS